MWVLFGGGGSWDRVLKENKGFTGVWVFGPVRNTRAATLEKTWGKVFQESKTVDRIFPPRLLANSPIRA